MGNRQGTEMDNRKTEICIFTLVEQLGLDQSKLPEEFVPNQINASGMGIEP
ncbi:hypothetical protein [Paenibacillus methanolicus]|uniref:Uncharacterized protein n=1 Tax=Paenibacillus methanolicus TaxID=582686 RepID=A0A5S5BVR1_9BACL|nr:hypothetical protein [Paenibacillus methanolicus]TYP70272.1 hypothetical protein BCM02_112252 [Paenibacillus methanolicus]